MARRHPEREISFCALQQDGMHPDPSEQAMPAIPDAAVRRCPLPLSLPMDEDVDEITLDDNPIDRKVEINLLKLLEIFSHLSGHWFQRVHGEQ